MAKVFLYLYPIENFSKPFLIGKDIPEIEKTLQSLNETINKRYREKGYKIAFALFPDKPMYGILKHPEDTVIYADTPFSEFSGIDENGKEKKDFTPKYPNELLLINQLGNVEQLVIGGYHITSCVKRVGEVSLQKGIDTLVDSDLTDLFFSLYNQEEYFKKDLYDPKRFREYMIKKDGETYIELMEQVFNRLYDSPVYGFNRDNQIIENIK